MQESSCYLNTWACSWYTRVSAESENLAPTVCDVWWPEIQKVIKSKLYRKREWVLLIRCFCYRLATRFLWTVFVTHFFELLLDVFATQLAGDFQQQFHQRKDWQLDSGVWLQTRYKLGEVLIVCEQRRPRCGPEQMAEAQCVWMVMD